jgi:beta-lactamase regulating signal transducer with metallopeptidase domain
MSWNAIASVAAERLLFSLGVGTLLAVLVWLLLRVLPRKDSRTSFAVWFATLVMIAVLPFFGMFSSHSGARSDAVITLSSAWAMYVFVAWAGIACVGLARVAVALRQVHRVRSEATPLEWKRLHPELGAVVEAFRRSRKVELLVSKRLEVPTAIGFFQPAIVLPQWLLEQTPAEELKYILLHELEHLRRRDDWTNLAQQIVKALLFFVPSVWWIERRLALEREMACDDAVLAQAGTARGYAECLAHVAERSFLRRQLRLAQAAVTKLRQLTVRVAKILDPNRPKAARVWRPAVPAVIVTAGLCVFTASQGPQLIGFVDGGPMAQSSAAAVAAGSLVPSSVGLKPVQPANTDAPKFVPAKLKLDPRADAPAVRGWRGPARPQKARSGKRAVFALANLGVENKIPRQAMVLAGLQPPQTPEYVTVREQFVMVVMQGEAAAGPQSWQVHVVEISVTKAQPQKQNPRKI